VVGPPESGATCLTQMKKPGAHHPESDGLQGLDLP